MEQSKGEDSQLELRQYLLQALTLRAKNVSSEDYQSLLVEVRTYKQQALKGDKLSIFAFCHLVESLAGCVSAINDRCHESLLSELYTIPFWDCTEALRTAVLGFMLHLLLVNVVVTQQTLQVLVHNLALPIGLAQQRKDAATGHDWEPLPETVAVHFDIITTLEKVMEHAPVATSLLLPILARGVPNKLLPRPVQCTYLRALLCLAESPRAGSLRDPILALIVQHLVSLDVEIRWQDITLDLPGEEERDEDELGGVEENIFELEGHTEQLQLDPSKFRAENQQNEMVSERSAGRKGFEGEAPANAQAAASTSGRTESDEAAEKLDSMMCLLFRHLAFRMRGSQLPRVRQALLNSFFATVLNTHRSKFTQYLLWYLLDQDPEQSSKLFLKRLFTTLADSRLPDITRSAAAAYIASFLARAAFLPEHLLLEAIEKLAKWCLAYCRAYRDKTPISPRISSENGALPAAAAHQVFYAACQGLLYVLCFRLEPLMTGQQTSQETSQQATQQSSSVQQLQQLFKDVLPELLKSRLKPTSVCLPTVVSEFGRLAARLGLLQGLDSLSLSGSETARSQRPLEMFFPFDPYLLRRSAAFLDLPRTYIRWKQMQSQIGEDEEEGRRKKSLQRKKARAAPDYSGSSDSGSSDSSDLGASDTSGSDDDDVGPEATSPATPVEPAGKRLKGRESQATIAKGPSKHSEPQNAALPMSWTPSVSERWSDRKLILS